MSASDIFDLLASPFAHGRVTLERGHRPWPLPRRPWVMGQTWKDLLFMHWPVDPQLLGRAVPQQLELETHGGSAWIGITPFAVRNLRASFTLPVPFASAFAETNVRTYVRVAGRPGIYFFSLDAASHLAVAAARRLYRLPYFHAEMSIERAGEEIRYATRRVGHEAPAPAALRCRYQPTGDRQVAVAGSLEHWLVERYCLYTLDEEGHVLRGEIHHPPWQLQRASAAIELNTMSSGLGIELDDQPLAHYSRRQDVVFWSLERAV